MQTLLSTILLLLISPTTWSAFNAWLDQETIREGESVQLLLESQGQVSGSPDTTPLLKAFEILGNSRSSQVNIINGQMSALTRWTLTLFPKQTGKLTIPPLQLEGEQSQPLTLTVKPAEVATAASGAPLFIESSVDLKTPYLQQMVHYRVQLFYRTKLAEGRLSDPQMDNVLIQSLGEDKEYTTRRNGVGYRVVERNYALFPQQSGNLTIPAPILDARIIVPTTQGRSSHPLDDLFNGGRRNNTKAVRIRGPEQTLEVRPRPPAHQHESWLPARSLRLSEQWLPEQEEITVGQPLSRTLTIEAEAVSGTMLPDLSPTAIAGFKLYPEPSTQQSEATGQQMVGRKIRKIAYIPTRPGHYTLPPLTLKWWNSEENQMEVAQLPERQIKVLPAATTAPQSLPPAGTTPEPQQIPTAAVQPPQPAVTSAQTLQPTFWLWTTVVFALLWILSLLLWWRSKLSRTESKPDTAVTISTASCSDHRKAFFHACSENHSQQARTTLLQWAACHWSEQPPKGLSELAGRLENPTAQTLLAELDRALYQQENMEWDGAPLQQHLRELPEVEPGHMESVLPPLYPEK